MNLDFTPEEEAFRAEVQRFLADELPPELSRKVKGGLRLTREDMQRWHAILHARGWLASHWPKEHGGPGWSVARKFLFDNECAIAGAPRIVPFGVNMLGPVLIKYGSEAQKRHWLPRILDGSDWWSRATRSRAPAPTWPRCAPPPCATAITTWSTAKRPGPRSTTTRT